MSKPTQPNLNEFFKKQGQKKQPVKTAASQQASQEEETKHSSADQKQDLATQAQTKKQNTNYESSDEEKTDITLGSDTATVIQDRKDVEAKKRKQLEQEQDSAKGWKALESQTNEKAPFMGSGGQKSQTSGPVVGQFKGATDAAKGDIKFTGKPASFQKKSKAQKINEDFPEIGSVTDQFEGQKTEEAVLSKKDMSSVGSFGSNAVGPRTGEVREREARPYQVEERKDASKPVFTSSKKKTLVGGADTEEIQNSKQNYDFSTLKTAQSTDKAPRPKGEEGTADGAQTDGRPPRQRREYGDSDPKPYTKPQAPVFEEDFETVTEKKRVVKPKESSEPVFGGKPSFTRTKDKN